MEFGLSESQRLFDDALRGALRAGQGGWDGLCALGLGGVLVPEAQGGSGLGMMDAALAAEALGYAASPAPFLGSGVMAPLALRLCGSPAQQEEHLPRLAAGEMRVAVGLGRARLDGERVSGTVRAVEAAEATHLLLRVAEDAWALLAAPPLAPRPALDRLRPLAEARLDAAPAEILRGDAGRVLDAGRVALAAETLGAAQSMLDRAVAYAGQRRQFGRPIAAFQAVKHACAEMAAMLEPCRAFVWYAAHAQDAPAPDARMLAASVKAHLDEVGREVARHATEVHGGMGFTELLGLPFWFKRIMANRQLLGGPERCREDAALAQGMGETAA
jgi:alkylation response protein AidB-like acyl-CoA dehydrogenase